MNPFKRSVEDDLRKCTARSGYRPIWQIAKINNAKPRAVSVKQVNSIPVMMGC